MHYAADRVTESLDPFFGCSRCFAKQYSTGALYTCSVGEPWTKFSQEMNAQYLVGWIFLFLTCRSSQ